MKTSSKRLKCRDLHLKWLHCEISHYTVSCELKWLFNWLLRRLKIKYHLNLVGIPKPIIWVSWLIWRGFCLGQETHQIPFINLRENRTLSVIVDKFTLHLPKYLMNLLAEMKHRVIPATNVSQVFDNWSIVLIKRRESFWKVKAKFGIVKINSNSSFSISYYLSLLIKLFLWRIRDNKVVNMQLTSYHKWFGVFDDWINSIIRLY